jgi:LysR family transcriptional regulator, low CO2-responsive transcriptional regulator
VTTLDVVPDGMDAVLLRRAGALVVMPRGHRLSRRRRVHLTDLAGERLILPPPTRPHRALVARALEAAAVRWETAVEATGWELMLHYAALGIGLAIVNDICRVPGGAVGRPLSGIPAVGYHVVHARRMPLSAPAQALKRLIVEAFERRR